MKKWRHINQLRHVVDYIRYHHPDNKYPTIVFEGSVKLHGTNAGIRRNKDGTIEAQGRNISLRVGDDNYGFAFWLSSQLEDSEFISGLNSLFDHIRTTAPIPSMYPNGSVEDESAVDDSTTIFGEWIGKGINSNCAIHSFETKKFVIFGAFYNGKYIRNINTFTHPHPDILNTLEAGKFFYEINFNDLSNVPSELQSITDDVEAECPFGKLYGFEGIGEGVVWNAVSDPTNSNLWFKIKGDKHVTSEKTSKKRATIDPEVLEKQNELLDYVLPQERLLQGLDQIDAIRMESLGAYLKWIGQDVKREELDTIEASGMEWNNIAKPINMRAKAFFIDQINKL